MTAGHHHERTTNMTAEQEETLYGPLRSLDTGDILLYRTKDLGATFNAVMQGSLYSHVSVVVCGDPTTLNEMYPDDYKENPPTSELAILEAVPTRGVTLFPLEARLIRSIGNIQTLVARRHAGIITTKARSNLDEFMKLVLGRGLEIATLEMARSLWFNRLRGKYGGENQEENWDEFFCSELVGEALQHLGIIRERGLNSNNLIPASFQERKNPTKDPNRTLHMAERITMPNHSYGPEEILICSTPPGASSCALKKELKRRKKIMKEQYRQQKREKQQQQAMTDSQHKQQQQQQQQQHEEHPDSSESSNGSSDHDAGDSSRNSNAPWWQTASLDKLTQNMSELRLATTQHMAQAKESAKKLITNSSGHHPKSKQQEQQQQQLESQRTVATTGTMSEGR